MMIKPSSSDMIASDVNPDGGFRTYLIADGYINRTWDYRTFTTLKAANKYARRVAKRYFLKISLLE